MEEEMKEIMIKFIMVILQNKYKNFKDDAKALEFATDLYKSGYLSDAIFDIKTSIGNYVFDADEE